MNVSTAIVVPPVLSQREAAPPGRHGAHASAPPQVKIVTGPGRLCHPTRPPNCTDTRAPAIRSSGPPLSDPDWILVTEPGGRARGDGGWFTARPGDGGMRHQAGIGRGLPVR